MLAFGSRPDLVIWKNATGTARAFNDPERVISFGLKGSADIIGFTNGGRFVAIECKTGNAKQTKSQLNFQKMCEKMGAVYILARNVDDVFREFDLHKF